MEKGYLDFKMYCTLKVLWGTENDSFMALLRKHPFEAFIFKNILTFTLPRDDISFLASSHCWALQSSGSVSNVYYIGTVHCSTYKQPCTLGSFTGELLYL